MIYTLHEKMRSLHFHPCKHCWINCQSHIGFDRYLTNWHRRSCVLFCVFMSRGGRTVIWYGRLCFLESGSEFVSWFPIMSIYLCYHEVCCHHLIVLQTSFVYRWRLLRPCWMSIDVPSKTNSPIMCSWAMLSDRYPVIIFVTRGILEVNGVKHTICVWNSD